LKVENVKRLAIDFSGFDFPVSHSSFQFQCFPETGIVITTDPFIFFKNKAIFLCNTMNLNEFMTVASFCLKVVYLTDSELVISMASFGFVFEPRGWHDAPGIATKCLILNVLIRIAPKGQRQGALADEFLSGMGDLFRSGSGRAVAPGIWLGKEEQMA
jgi:hypothetical protein